MAQTDASDADGGRTPAPRAILFVAGNEPNSRMARQNLQRICESLAHGQCQVQIVDVLEDYYIALSYNVLLTPCLLIHYPSPSILIVGNLSDETAVHAASHPNPERTG